MCASSSDVAAEVRRVDYGALCIDGTLNHLRVRVTANLRALQLLRRLGIPRRKLWQYCACGRERCRHAYLV